MIHPSSGRAYEVDNFSERGFLKRDALEVLDRKIETLLDRAAAGVAREDPGRCNRAILRQEILRWIRPDPTGILELWLELTEEIERTPIGVRNSVYRGISFFDSPIMRVFGIGRSFLLAGQVIGTDKIGHFFMQGLDFYDRVKEGQTLESVLAHEHGEDGLWGLGTSGIKSWADIAADYQGYRFWSRLTEGSDPYFVCDEDQGFVRKARFTWADYVNAAWDEAINCSEMKPDIREKVGVELSRQGLVCPVDPEACTGLSLLEYATYFVSPACLHSR
jgi:hypothetical protein